MKLTTQKRISADLLKCGVNRVWFDPNRLTEIKEAITKADIRGLIKDIAIQKRLKESIVGSSGKARLIQKRKGRLGGPGSRKGKKRARLNAKEQWIHKIRAQRKFIQKLKEKGVAHEATKDMYRKSGGGFFRSISHMKLYMEEHKIGEHEKHENQNTPVQKKKAK